MQITSFRIQLQNLTTMNPPTSQETDNSTLYTLYEKGLLKRSADDLSSHRSTIDNRLLARTCIKYYPCESTVKGQLRTLLRILEIYPDLWPKNQSLSQGAALVQITRDASAGLVEVWLLLNNNPDYQICINHSEYDWNPYIDVRAANVREITYKSGHIGHMCLRCWNEVRYVTLWGTLRKKGVCKDVCKMIMKMVRESN
jgi:hypothetical protein